MNFLKRVQVSSRRRVEFHIRNKSRDSGPYVRLVNMNGHDAESALQREFRSFSNPDPKLAV